MSASRTFFLGFATRAQLQTVRIKILFGRLEKNTESQSLTKTQSFSDLLCLEPSEATLLYIRATILFKKIFFIRKAHQLLSF